jgi:3-oxoacyl-[acyl-carrier protein] reductase
MASLDGRVALVTGGSKGIGYGIARALAAEGASVAISARDQTTLEEAAKSLRQESGGRVLPVPCDVRRHGDVERMIRRIVDELGGLDILVNNAGVGAFGEVGKFEVEQWDRVIETNLSGVFYCCREAIPHLAKGDDGWIINIGSLAGKNAFAGGAAYNASKFGLIGFSEALMLDVRHQGIRVNYIMPGSVASDFTGPGGRHSDGDTAWKLQPEDIAQLVLGLLAFPTRALPSRIEVRPTRPPVPR